MTDIELDALIALLQNHSAISRVGYGELVAAFRFAESQGYKINAPKVTG